MYINLSAFCVFAKGRWKLRPFLGFQPTISSKQVPTVTIIKEYLPLHQLSAQHGPFIKLAGVMGATAVSLGAYGAHRKYPKDRVDELKAVCQTANTYHFFHSLALLGVPFTRRPGIVSFSLVYSKCSRNFVLPLRNFQCRNLFAHRQVLG